MSVDDGAKKSRIGGEDEELNGEHEGERKQIQ